MLVLKVVIALAIVCICAYVGISKAKKYESREYILTEAIMLFSGIENEIKYTLATLPNAIEAVRINMKTGLKDVLGSIGCELLRYNASSEQIASEISNLQELTPYDKQIISNGIIELGKTDLEGQIGIINRTCSVLKNQLEDAIESKKKNSKMYKTIGFATGLMIAIVFI